MIKYFSLILMCVTSLYAMDADAPLPDGSHETGSSSSSSSIVLAPEGSVSCSDLPREIVEDEMIKGRARTFDRLNIALTLMPRQEGESPQDYVERTCNFVGAKTIYFNDRTKKLLNTEDPIRVQSAPTSLIFSDRMTSQEIEKLAQKFPNIKRVDIPKDVIIRLPHIQALSAFQYLQHLDTKSAYFGDEEARSIAHHLKGLTTLNVSLSSIGNGGAIALANALPNLTWLDIAGTDINDGGAIALANALPNLTWLNIASTDIRREGISALSRELDRLTSLTLSINNIEPVDIKTIADGFLNLTSLWITPGFRTTSEKTNAIAKVLAQHFPRRHVEGRQSLKSLRMPCAQLTDAGVIDIAQNLKSLTYLDISLNSVSGNALRVIGGNLKNLKSLWITNNGIPLSFDDVAILLNALPHHGEVYLGNSPRKEDERSQLRAMWKGSPSKFRLG